MKVKIQINGQTYEKEVDDSGPVTINMSSGNGATDSDFFEKAFESFDKAFDESESVSFDIPATPQPGKPRKEYRTYPTWFLGDTIQREITYDDEGNIIDIQDRNLDAEARAEHRRLNKIKKDIEWKKTPLWAKIPAYIIVILFFGFLWWLFILGVMGAVK